MFNKDQITDKIKDYLYPDTEYRLIDALSFPRFTLENMEELILAIFPNVTDYVIMISESEEEDADTVYREYFLHGFLRMLLRITQEKDEWFEEHNPELLRTLKAIDRL